MGYRLLMIYTIIILIQLFIFSFFICFIPSLYALTFNNCLNNSNDFDGDDIPNNLEMNSRLLNDPFNPHSKSILEGSDYMTKDIFVELDYFENHFPNTTGLAMITESFKKSSLCNPSGIEGINLHFLISDRLKEDSQSMTIECFPDNKTRDSDWSEYDSLKNTYFGTIEERNWDNKDLLDLKKSLYHYGIIGHQFNNLEFSGCAKPSEMNFLVTLGADWWKHELGVNKDTGDTLSNADFEAAAIMHELGHTLGLKHGGGDSVQYKPNYISIMNYLFQMPYDSGFPDRPLDYSNCDLKLIRENLVNESKGVQGTCHSNFNRTSIGYNMEDGTIACDRVIVTELNRPIDYNGNGKIENKPYTTNLNCDKGRNNITALWGYNDWKNLDYLIH